MLFYKNFSEINKQFTLGFASIIVVMAITAGIVISVDEPFLGTWLALFFISCVPTQVLLGIWHNADFPKVLIKACQPLKGLINLLITTVVGFIVTIASFYVVGGGASFPRPPVIHYSIVTVVVTFWYVIIWQCWPVSSTKKFGPLLQAIIMFLVVYGFGYIVFINLFDFGFMKDAPIYIAKIDPGGIFNAWYAVSFLVTTVAVIFSLVLLDFWPIIKWIKPDKKFYWGLINSLIILAVSGIIYGVVVLYFGCDPVKYLIHGPVSFIFGVFIPLNLLEGKLFNAYSQPAKGLRLILVSVISGVILNKIYFGFPKMMLYDTPSGLPSYELELWVANAMLAFSFPVLVAFTDHFNFWPLRLNKK